MKCVKPPRAFTLMEVLLALALIVSLMAAVLIFYRQAVDVRAMVSSQARHTTQVRMVMDLLTREVRAALPRGSPMTGQSDQIQFASTQLPGPDAWMPPAPDQPPSAPQQGLMQLSYRLRIYEDQEGYWHNDGLERSAQNILRPRVLQESQAGQEMVSLIAPDLHFVYFRFHDGSAWQDQWSGNDLPLGVEITLGLEPLPQDTEPALYPYETFRRVVYMPGAAQPDPATVVRGLDEGRSPGPQGGRGGEP